VRQTGGSQTNYSQTLNPSTSQTSNMSADNKTQSPMDEDEAHAIQILDYEREGMSDDGMRITIDPDLDMVRLHSRTTSLYANRHLRVDMCSIVCWIIF
jgi:hypothetical protein